MTMIYIGISNFVRVQDSIDRLQNVVFMQHYSLCQQCCLIHQSINLLPINNYCSLGSIIRKRSNRFVVGQVANFLAMSGFKM